MKDAQGLKGEIYALIFSKDSSWIKKLKNLKIADTFYEVQTAKAHKEGMILKVKGIDDRTAAEKIRGGMIFVPSEIFASKKGETIFLAEIENFKVFNEGGEVGTITSFSSNGPQDLLVVENKELKKSYEIPFVEAFIEKIDFENKKILMNLPEGLLTLDEK